MGKSFVGDVGAKIHIDCGRDVSGATGVLFKVKKPDGTEVDVTPVISGTNWFVYTVESDHWDQAGDFLYQWYGTLGTFTGLGETAEHTVYATFTKYES